jgi:hypothetical protein
LPGRGSNIAGRRNNGLQDMLFGMVAFPHLTYYYDNTQVPFRSLSALPDADAVHIMETLYAESPDSIVFDRFKDPAGYLQARRRTEQWVRSEFVASGGRPEADQPVSLVLGSSAWIADHAPGPPATHGEIRIPLSEFEPDQVSFTFPDSMVSFWLGAEKPAEYYLPDYHGRVFTMEEILSIIETRGMPEETWPLCLPPDTGPYIEAQVWNHEVLKATARDLFHSDGGDGHRRQR